MNCYKIVYIHRLVSISQWHDASSEPKELSTAIKFEASLSWYFNWKRCHCISMGMKTSLAQCLQDETEDKLVEFKD